jgi:bifunctional DNase/RNase
MAMTQVRCEVKGVFVAMSTTATMPLVVLSDGNDRLLPIFIGIWEAVSIHSAQIKEVLPRPFTHDLFIDLCARFSITLRYLQIDSIDDGVYYAQLVMNSGFQDEYLDCRPSDGIALALRGDIPIFVEESVLVCAGQKPAELPDMVDLSEYLQE